MHTLYIAQLEDRHMEITIHNTNTLIFEWVNMQATCG